MLRLSLQSDEDQHVRKKQHEKLSSEINALTKKCDEYAAVQSNIEQKLLDILSAAAAKYGVVNDALIDVSRALF